jgi:hypothetical protein
MSRKKGLLELRKLSEDSNPRLGELLAEISDPANPDSKPSLSKRIWGRRFNASGKNKNPQP